jgi:DNA-3-methyladenine glycosylase
MSLAELREILIKDVVASAQALVGAELVKGLMRARIVETEAYRGSDDPASHAFRGPTPRTQVMFGEPGLAYMYFNYGVHWMLNVTTYASGQAGAVLIRAAQPLAGLEEMRENRPGVHEKDLLSGPGKLAKAFGLTGADNFIDLLDLNSPLRLIPARTIPASFQGFGWASRTGRLTTVHGGFWMQIA